MCPPSQIFLETPHVPHRTCDECGVELEMIRSALRARVPRRSSEPHPRSAGAGTSAAAAAVNSAGRRARAGTNPSAVNPTPGIKRFFEPIVETTRPVSSSSPSSSPQLAPQYHHHHHTGGVGLPGNEDEDEDSTCPVCSQLFALDLTTTDREQHIASCLTTSQFSGSPDKLRANRMIIYRLSGREAQGLEECVICFEEFTAGEAVGRLECLCVYHEKCILDWFARKGAGECPVHAVHA